MKLLHCVALSLSLLALPALAQDLLKPPSQQDLPMIDSGPAPHIVSEPVVQTNGRIESVDPEAEQVSITHDVVPELKWPASTKDFQARRELLEGFSAGDQVRITFQSEGGEAALVSIEKR